MKITENPCYNGIDFSEMQPYSMCFAIPPHCVKDNQARFNEISQYTDVILLYRGLGLLHVEISL